MSDYGGNLVATLKLCATAAVTIAVILGALLGWAIWR